MITASPLTRHPENWQQELAQAITSPAELCRVLGLDPALVPAAAAAATDFRLRVPRGFVARMRRGDPNDPLLRQVLPMAAELQSPADYSADPLAESAARSVPGLLHKYRGRALLVTTGACAVHCRYCFRREYPYADDQTDSVRWQPAIDAVAADSSIEELILSGGDPLSLSDARLRELTDRLTMIPHLRRLRVHTRQPIVLPERVSAGLLDWLRALRWPTVIVLHANHANEIDGSVIAACERLRAAGATLLNQSVLLAGVNDSAAALHALSLALWEAGVLPYYLHALDRVRGASHFAVDELQARQLHADLLATLPGYLVPRLVREIPGAASKLPLSGDIGAARALK